MTGWTSMNIPNDVVVSVADLLAVLELVRCVDDQTDDERAAVARLKVMAG